MEFTDMWYRVVHCMFQTTLSGKDGPWRLRFNTFCPTCTLLVIVTADHIVGIGKNERYTESQERCTNSPLTQGTITDRSFEFVVSDRMRLPDWFRLHVNFVRVGAPEPKRIKKQPPAFGIPVLGESKEDAIARIERVMERIESEIPRVRKINGAPVVEDYDYMLDLWRKTTAKYPQLEEYKNSEVSRKSSRMEVEGNTISFEDLEKLTDASLGTLGHVVEKLGFPKSAERLFATETSIRLSNGLLE